MNSTRTATAALMAAFLGTTALAQDVALMDGVEPRPEGNSIVAEGAFQTEAPWTVAMSHFGVNANTWTVQTAHEAQGIADADSRIENFIMLDANFDQAKQVADIEDLIAQDPDVLIVMPVTPTSADAGIQKAIDAGIPVVVHTGRTENQNFTVDIQGGAENFGRVMGDFLVEQIGNEGRIWVLRGLPSHPEDINRYNGLMQALEGTSIEITQEDYGSWVYDLGKSLCETFYLNDPIVDAIWSSGADMTRACVDVLTEFGADIPPITGEGNNGFFGQWLEMGYPSIVAEYSPSQAAAGVRAAVALLEGEALHKHYIYEPEGWDAEKAAQFYRSDLSANVWWPTELPEETLQELYGN
ncbi:MAG: substrate-binding domain-containing protein [Pseudomonadota bacterium]